MLIDFFSDKYLTDEERKSKLVRNENCFTFETCIDLSQPIKVSSEVYKKDQDRYLEQLAIAISGFMCWWSRDVHKKLNGFSGTDCVKWIFED